jgi:rhamnogalacturonyl hydrolase YesR
MKTILPLTLLALLPAALAAQSSAAPAAAPAAVPPSPLASLRAPPAYPVPYAPASVEQITATLDRVRTYLEKATPYGLVDRATGQPVADPALPADAVVPRGDFLIVSYEWGVTYSGMLLAAEATGDARFKEYAARRLKFIAEAAPRFKPAPGAGGPPPGGGQGGGIPPAALFRSVNAPRSLDDSGSMCAAMIKAHRAGVEGGLRPAIDTYIDWITAKQFRLADGTLARNRPLPNALWLDDLYMSVPALAQMGKLTGERRYYDDAVKQILQFSERMFDRSKGLYLHGWIQEMKVHPAFHWARANGWAIMAMTELLEVLPEDHPGRAAVLDLYRAQARGLAATQSGTGRWHQLLDRNDSYLETSATAIFAYSLARGINRGWIDALAYGPMVSLAWNAVAQQVNDQGQVEGTCVGTGMGFEPMFYYFRPTNVYAAHGYGPVLLAGAELIALRRGQAKEAQVSDGAVQLQRSPSRF